MREGPLPLRLAWTLALPTSRPPTALQRMAKLSFRHRLNVQQFCRARPVRAPKAEHWLSARPSASKNAAATGMVREREAFPLTFHTQWLVKGSRARTPPFTSDRFAFDGERPGDSRNPFSLRARSRQPLWKRLAMCEAIHQLGCAHGARTAKLLRTSQRPSQCTTLKIAIDNWQHFHIGNIPHSTRAAETVENPAGKCYTNAVLKR